MKIESKIKGIVALCAAILCAVLMTIVGVLIVNNNNATTVADAATVNASRIVVGEQKFASETTQTNICPAYSIMVPKSADSYYNKFKANLSNSDKTLVLTMDSEDTRTKAMWVDFEVKIKVPKYTKYDINYTFDLKGRKTALHTDSVSPLRMELYDFSKGHTGSSGINAGSIVGTQFLGKDNVTNAWTTPSNTTWGVWSDGTLTTLSDTTFTVTGTYNQSFSCDNTSNPNDKEFAFKFGAYASLGYNSGRYASKFIYQIGLSEKKTISQTAAPTVDKTSYNYDGNNHDFIFTYDESQVALANYTIEKVNGTSTTPYTYDVNNGSSSGTNPINITGGSKVLTLREAGKYKLDFELKNGWVWNSTTNDQTTKTIYVYIFPEKVGVPTVAAANKKKPYTGSALTFSTTLPSGLTAADWPSKISVPALLGVTDNNDGTFTMTDVNKYNIPLSLQDPINTVWGDTTWTTSTWDKTKAGGTRNVEFEIAQKQVTYPTLTPNTYTYTGETQTLNLSGWSSDVNLSIAGGDGQVNNTTGKITAKAVDNYTITVSLKDTANTRWADGTTSTAPITFKIDPKELEVKLTNSLNGWSWQKADVGTIDVEVSGICPNDRVTLSAYYLKSTNKVDQASATSNGSGDTSVKATLVTEKLDTGNYTLNAELDATAAANYTLKAGTLPKNITVEKEGIKLNGVKWLYTHDNVEETTADTTLSGYVFNFDDSLNKLKYRLKSDGNASVYEFFIDVNTLKGASLDTSKYDQGYKDAKVSTAGTHTVTVALKADTGFTFADGSLTKDITLTLEVAKGDFDTTGVKWQYKIDGESTSKEYTQALEYAAKNYVVEIMPSSLPTGLSVGPYNGNKNRDVNSAGAHYTATATFTCDTANYNVPANVTLEWSIVKANIIVDWDYSKTPPVLKETRAGGGIVVYKVYTDENCTDEIDFSQVVPDETKAVKYYIKAEINSAYNNNYMLTDASGKYYTDFSVGGSKLPLTVSAKFGDDKYNGQAHEATVEVLGAPGLVVGTDYVLTYYSVADDGTETVLTAAPKDAGKYCVKVTLTKSAAANYELKDDTEFSFEVKKGVLDISAVKWNYTEAFQYGTKDGTPIVYTVELEGLPEYLQGIVKYTGNSSSNFGKKLARFEFVGFDENNYEPLVYPEGLQTELNWEISIRLLEKPTVKHPRSYHTGDEQIAEIVGLDSEYMELSGELKGTEIGEYKVTVHIKDTKYVRWADNSDKDIELTFTIISPGEPLDPDNPDNPDDPNNPDNPPDDPNNPDNPNGDKPVGPGVINPDDNNNGDGGFKLPDNFPLWQLIVGGVSIVLTIVFSAKAAGYAGQAKKMRKKTDKIGGQALAAGAMVNGMLFGVSNTWWTVIALSLAGVMVVSFVIMLLMKRSLTNAEEAYDEAEANFKAERERLEKQRHDEEMKMLMMMMNGGKGGGVAYAPGGVGGLSERDLDAIASRVTAALLPNMQQAAAQITAGGSEYDDAELRHRIEELEGRDDGFDDVIEVDMDEFK